MSLPARKQPGASRRRKQQSHLRHVRRRLLGQRAWADPVSGRSVMQDVRAMIKQLKRDRKQ